MGSDSPAQNDNWSYDLQQITIHDVTGWYDEQGRYFVLNYRKQPKESVRQDIVELISTMKETPTVCVNSQQAVELVLENALSVTDLRNARERKRVITCEGVRLGNRVVDLIIAPFGHALFWSNNVITLPQK